MQAAAAAQAAAARTQQAAAGAKAAADCAEEVAAKIEVPHRRMAHRRRAVHRRKAAAAPSEAPAPGARAARRLPFQRHPRPRSCANLPGSSNSSQPSTLWTLPPAISHTALENAATARLVGRACEFELSVPIIYSYLE